MTDRNLYEHIRRLVKEQKEQHVLDSKQDNFAEEYCKKQISKKKQVKNRETRRVSNLFKNFKNVESYINIMDIINNLPLHLNKTTSNFSQSSACEQLPQILPKSLQMKMKQQLGPILNKRYQEQQVKRKDLMESLRLYIDCSNDELIQNNPMMKEIYDALENNRMSQKLDLIDILRKDIKMKQIYFFQKRFDKEMEDINKEPKKIEHTKLFHKICSYLHMILQQEHKEKWASKKDRQLREQYHKQNVRKKFRIPTIIRTASNSVVKQNQTRTHFHNRFKTNFKQNRQYYQDQPDCTATSSNFIDIKVNKHPQFEENNCDIEEERDECKLHTFEKGKKLQSKQELLKDSFTFRKRGIKKGLMIKINAFVDGMIDEEKKNVQISKKYGKALHSLAEQLKTSYGRFQHQQIAQDEDIEDMKKYLDNTLSRNKKDLKKFHHR